MTDDPIRNALASIKPKKKQSDTSRCTFAKVMDKFGNISYLSAYTEEEIDKYCDGGVLGDDLAVCEYAYNVSPIVAAHHFKWVGKGKDPYRISTPFDYDDPFKKPVEKW
tara:strand:+ start:430 stop:756 length:327 start_codon:yes stop_codon:yes gene_type:complete